MKDIPLSQDELKVLVGTLTRIQIAVGDSRPFLALVDKLIPYIDQPKEEDVTKKPPLVESEVVK
jgi:hypothetical protein